MDGMKRGAADDPFAEDEDDDAETPIKSEPAAEDEESVDYGPTGRVKAIMKVLAAQDAGEAATSVRPGTTRPRGRARRS